MNQLIHIDDPHDQNLTPSLATNFTASSYGCCNVDGTQCLMQGLTGDP